jgi:hypothetical protein
MVDATIQEDEGLKTEACGAGAVGGKRVFAIVHVCGWAGRDVLVDRWLLLVPRDAHARTLGKSKMELCSENTCSASGGGLAEFFQRCPLLGDDHLDDEVVLYTHAGLAVHVAKWFEREVAGSHELDIDFAFLKVGLPASLDFLVGDGADILV